MKRSIGLVFVLIGLVGAPSLWADGVQDIEEAMATVMPPTVRPSSIKKSVVEGIYEVEVEGNLFFATRVGDYLMLGEVFDLKRNISLIDERQSVKIKEALTGVTRDEMLIIGPANAKRHVTVFTDIDCGYCRRFHVEVPALNKAGLEVRYLMFPRAGVGSESYRKSVSVWCAEDRATAITDAKLGNEVPERECDNPVTDHYQLGQEVGVSGTPTMVLDTGIVIPGYLPAKELLARLGMKEAE